MHEENVLFDRKYGLKFLIIFSCTTLIKREGNHLKCLDRRFGSLSRIGNAESWFWGKEEASETLNHCKNAGAFHISHSLTYIIQTPVSGVTLSRPRHMSTPNASLIAPSRIRFNITFWFPSTTSKEVTALELLYPVRTLSKQVEKVEDFILLNNDL